jgi:hypothetical protein
VEDVAEKFPYVEAFVVGAYSNRDSAGQVYSSLTLEGYSAVLIKHFPRNPRNPELVAFVWVDAKPLC